MFKAGFKSSSCHLPASSASTHHHLNNNMHRISVQTVPAVSYTNQQSKPVLTLSNGLHKTTQIIRRKDKPAVNQTTLKLSATSIHESQPSIFT
jgi:hypothetical protein